MNLERKDHASAIPQASAGSENDTPLARLIVEWRARSRKAQAALKDSSIPLWEQAIMSSYQICANELKAAMEGYYLARKSTPRTRPEFHAEDDTVPAAKVNEP